MSFFGSVFQLKTRINRAISNFFQPPQEVIFDVVGTAVKGGLAIFLLNMLFNALQNQIIVDNATTVIKELTHLYWGHAQETKIGFGLYHNKRGK